MNTKQRYYSLALLGYVATLLTMILAFEGFPLKPILYFIIISLPPTFLGIYFGLKVFRDKMEENASKARHLYYGVCAALLTTLISSLGTGTLYYLCESLKEDIQMSLSDHLSRLTGGMILYGWVGFAFAIPGALIFGFVLGHMNYKALK